VPTASAAIRPEPPPRRVVAGRSDGDTVVGAESGGGG
jgi:hypothetical protein